MKEKWIDKCWEWFVSEGHLPQIAMYNNFKESDIGREMNDERSRVDGDDGWSFECDYWMTS